MPICLGQFYIFKFFTNNFCFKIIHVGSYRSEWKLYTLCQYKSCHCAIVVWNVYPKYSTPRYCWLGWPFKHGYTTLRCWSQTKHKRDHKITTVSAQFKLCNSASPQFIIEMSTWWLHSVSATTSVELHFGYVPTVGARLPPPLEVVITVRIFWQEDKHTVIATSDYST